MNGMECAVLWSYGETVDACTHPNRPNGAGGQTWQAPRRETILCIFACDRNKADNIPLTARTTMMPPSSNLAARECISEAPRGQSVRFSMSK